jgi:NodT family efflux transporter outer membrane factor (OMF) lipoprotein
MQKPRSKSGRRRTSVGIALLIATGLGAGCKVGPDYHAPRQPMPAQWSSPAPPPTTQASVTVQPAAPVERWWTTFGDPVLDSLVARAVASNLDLRLATERVREARASLGVVSSGLFPAANVGGSYTRSGTGTSGGRNFWRTGFDAAWELDVFGGVRRAVESSTASLQATVEDRRDVLVTLLGDVATNYILLRGTQQEIAIAQNNLGAQARNARLTREKKRLGTGTDLDIAQADAQVASTTAATASLRTQERQTVYALSVLLGSPPTALDDELQPREAIPAPPPVVPVGLPSDLLRRRPDIRRAERQLAAATAGIGVATADLFPRFSLTGSAGLQGPHAQSLVNADNHFWAIGPAFSWPIFDAGRIRSNIEVQNALQAQALATYQKTVLTALQEVQGQLVAYAEEQNRRAALADAVTFNQRAVELATRRYNQGLTDFLSVLDAQRSLFASQDALVQSNRTVSTTAVALYKALGGGWEIEERPTAPAATTQPAAPDPAPPAVTSAGG